MRLNNVAEVLCYDRTVSCIAQSLHQAYERIEVSTLRTKSNARPNECNALMTSWLALKIVYFLVMNSKWSIKLTKHNKISIRQDISLA